MRVPGGHAAKIAASTPTVAPLTSKKLLSAENSAAAAASVSWIHPDGSERSSSPGTSVRSILYRY
jgi:hypothetical protein